MQKGIFWREWNKRVVDQPDLLEENYVDNIKTAKNSKERRAALASKTDDRRKIVGMEENVNASLEKRHGRTATPL